MRLRSFYWALIYMVLISKALSAQSYIADTLLVNFTPDTVLQLRSGVSFTDERTHEETLISIFEKKKWLFFPVDQIVVTQNPLATEMKTVLNANKPISHHLSIKHFYVYQSSATFKKNLQVVATLQLNKLSAMGDTLFMGTFFYDEPNKFKNKLADTIAFNHALNSFTSQFIWDLNGICSDTATKKNLGAYNFRYGTTNTQKNFYVSTDWYLGTNFWGFDGEIYFSLPEPSKKFNRRSRMVRYLKFDNRQSVAFSSGIKYLNYRLNERLLVQNKSAFLLGFNNWTDVDEAKRTLEEIFMFQYTMTQRITFNKLDQKGFVFGMGLMEEVSYIFYNDPMFNVGLMFNCAYKF